MLNEVFFRYFVREVPRVPPVNETVEKSVMVPTGNHETDGVVIAGNTVELLMERNGYLSSIVSSYPKTAVMDF